jgi:hypothetical protein
MSANLYNVVPYLKDGATREQFIAIMRKVYDPMGWDFARVRNAFDVAWQRGMVQVVGAFAPDGTIVGGAVLMISPSPIHNQDAMIQAFAPVEGEERRLVAYCKMLAKSKGAGGLSLPIGADAPLSLVQAVVEEGLKAKAITYGVGL